MRSKRVTTILLWLGLMACFVCLGMAWYGMATGHDRWQTLAWLSLVPIIMAGCIGLIRRASRMSQDRKREKSVLSEEDLD